MLPCERLPRRLRRTALAVILAAAALVRTIDAVGQRAHGPYWTVPVADCKFYDDWALALASGRGGPEGAYWQPPLYPFVLGGIYRALATAGWLEHRFDVVFVLQLALGVANVFLTWSIARRLFGDGAALLASLLFVLYPTALFFETKLLITTLGLFLTLASIRFLLAAAANGRRPVLRGSAAGLALGLSCTARADRLLFVPLALGWLLRRAAGRRAAVLASATVAALVPIGIVTARNFAVAGAFVPISANGPINLYFGNHPGASGINMGADARFGSLATQREDARRVASERLGRRLDDAEAGRFWVGEVLSFWRTDPHEAMRVFARKLRLSISDLEADIGWLPEAEASFRPLMRRLPVRFGLLLGLGLAGLLLAWRRPGVGLLALHLLSVFLVLWIFFMGARFRLPAAPILAVLGGGFFVEAFSRLRRGRYAAPVAGLLLAVAMAAFARHEARTFRLAPDEPPLARLLEANATQIVGQAYAEQGRIAEARGAFRRVLELNPYSFKARYALGRLALEQARSIPIDRRNERLRWLGIARRHLEQSLRLYSDWPEPHVALAELALDRADRDPAEALAHLERALALAPGDFGLLVRKARVLQLMGRDAEAAALLERLERMKPGDPSVRALRDAAGGESAVGDGDG